MKKKSIVGIAWFNKNDWGEWKKISPDEMENTFGEWFTQALDTKLGLQKKGFEVKQVNITPANFLNWCKQNNKKTDYDSISKYVSELLEIVHL